MKKIEYIGDDPRQKRALQTINENFQEIFLTRMQVLDEDPKYKLELGMTYYNRKLKKMRILISLNPVMWENIN